MKNEYEVRGKTTVIFLKRNNGSIIEALIDTEDLEKAKEFPFTWFARWSPTNDTYYVGGNTPVINGKANSIRLHCYLLGVEKGMVVDHINHDTLDNRKNNLRILTKAQNMQNRKGPTKNNKSGYRGVSWSKNNQKWAAYVRIDQKLMSLGYYNDKHAAARVAELARKELMPYATS